MIPLSPGEEYIRTLTPGPSPFPSRPPSQGEGKKTELVWLVGCAVRTVKVVHGAHSAPYALCGPEGVRPDV